MVETRARAFDTAVLRKPLSFARGGRYGFSIDSGLEVVGEKRDCDAPLKSMFIALNHEVWAHDRLDRLILTPDRPFCKTLVWNLRWRSLWARESVRRRAASFKRPTRSLRNCPSAAESHSPPRGGTSRRAWRQKIERGIFSSKCSHLDERAAIS